MKHNLLQTSSKDRITVGKTNNQLGNRTIDTMLKIYWFCLVGFDCLGFMAYQPL